MTWKTIDSAPKDKWILVKAKIIDNSYNGGFVIKDNENEYYVYVSRFDSLFETWKVNTNTCGCCEKEIQPYEWKEIE